MYEKKTQPKICKKSKKLICGWSDKKNYGIHYKMLKLYVRHGMIVEKLHEMISLKQNKWLEKYINFNVQRRNRAENEFEKDFYKLISNAFYGKTMENVGTPSSLEFVKKVEYRKILKQQSQLTFKGIHKSYENCDSYTFKQNEVLMDQPIYLGFALIELSKLHMHAIYYDKLQFYFGQESSQLQYIDTDAFVLSVNTKHNIKNLKNSEEIFDFSNIDENHGLFSKKIKKVIGKF